MANHYHDFLGIEAEKANEYSGLIHAQYQCYAEDTKGG